MEEQDCPFDECIDRSNTGSLKWDLMDQFFQNSELLPLWIADMDFRAPQPIIDALTERAQHGIYGYTGFMPSYYESVLSWFQRRHNWTLKKEWLVYTPGIIPAINLIIRTFSNPGDKIIVQNPVYYPFYDAIINNGRQILYNPLKMVNGHYKMDFDDLELKVKDSKARIMILCSPHNPVGRIWTKEELTRLGRICFDNDLLIISDEIHSDLQFPGYKHTPFASLNEEFAQHSITCTSASKTFNLAGMQISNIIIPNLRTRQKLQNALVSDGLTGPNSFAGVALETAYNKCEQWLDDMLQYIYKNLCCLREYLAKNLPQIKLIEPEGLYLVWLDFRALGLDHKQLELIMQKDAKVALDEGYIFGPGGEGFERINLACPRSILKDALDRIAKVIQNL